MKRMQQEMSFCAWFCWNRRRQGVRWSAKSISVSASKEIISSPLLVEHEKKNLNQSMTSFCASQILSGRRVAVVTSGSTTVPMDAHAIEYNIQIVSDQAIVELDVQKVSFNVAMRSFSYIGVDLFFPLVVILQNKLRMVGLWICCTLMETIPSL